jgi:hypothetical protein
MNMSDTPSLFDALPDFVPDAAAGTIQERFEEFHRLNPWVYEALEKLIADYAGRGRKRLSIKMVWEVLRWHYNRATTDPHSEFKVNNNYHSRYARLLIERHPEWSEFFELRALKAS